MFETNKGQYYIVSDDGVNIVATRTGIPPKPSGFIRLLWGIMVVMIFCVFTYGSDDDSLHTVENPTAVEAAAEYDGLL